MSASNRPWRGPVNPSLPGGMTRPLTTRTGCFGDSAPTPPDYGPVVNSQTYDNSTSHDGRQVFAVTLDRVNYGVSPGDGTIGTPYAYVGPWEPVEGAFWNAPFGAARPLRGLGSADAVLAWFLEGSALLR